MAITNGYTDLATVKTKLGISDSDTTQDGDIETAIEAASRGIDFECGRVFFTSGSDESPQARVFTAKTYGRIWIDDLISLASLKTDDDGDGLYETTWTVTDYRLKPSNAAAKGEPFMSIELHPAGARSFPRIDEGVEVSGVWGYQATLPPEIAKACVREAVRLYKSDDAPFGTQGSSEFGTQTVQTAYDPIVRKLLAPFKLIRVA